MKNLKDNLEEDLEKLNNLSMKFNLNDLTKSNIKPNKDKFSHKKRNFSEAVNLLKLFELKNKNLPTKKIEQKFLIKQNSDNFILESNDNLKNINSLYKKIENTKKHLYNTDKKPTILDNVNFNFNISDSKNDTSRNEKNSNKKNYHKSKDLNNIDENNLVKKLEFFDISEYSKSNAQFSQEDDHKIYTKLEKKITIRNNNILTKSQGYSNRLLSYANGFYKMDVKPILGKIKEIQEINSSKNKNDSVNFCSNYYTDDENNYKKNSQYLKDIEILNEINLEKSECEQYTNNHNISNQNLKNITEFQSNQKIQKKNLNFNNGESTASKSKKTKSEINKNSEIFLDLKNSSNRNKKFLIKPKLSVSNISNCNNTNSSVKNLENIDFSRDISPGTYKNKKDLELKVIKKDYNTFSNGKYNSSNKPNKKIPHIKNISNNIPCKKIIFENSTNSKNKKTQFENFSLVTKRNFSNSKKNSFEEISQNKNNNSNKNLNCKINSEKKILYHTTNKSETINQVDDILEDLDEIKDLEVNNIKLTKSNKFNRIKYEKQIITLTDIDVSSMRESHYNSKVLNNLSITPFKIKKNLKKNILIVDSIVNSFDLLSQSIKSICLLSKKNFFLENLDKIKFNNNKNFKNSFLSSHYFNQNNISSQRIKNTFFNLNENNITTNILNNIEPLSFLSLQNKTDNNIMGNSFNKINISLSKIFTKKNLENININNFNKNNSLNPNLENNTSYKISKNTILKPNENNTNYNNILTTRTRIKNNNLLTENNENIKKNNCLILNNEILEISNFLNSDYNLNNQEKNKNSPREMDDKQIKLERINDNKFSDMRNLNLLNNKIKIESFPNEFNILKKKILNNHKNSLIFEDQQKEKKNIYNKTQNKKALTSRDDFINQFDLSTMHENYKKKFDSINKNNIKIENNSSYSNNNSNSNTNIVLSINNSTNNDIEYENIKNISTNRKNNQTMRIKSFSGKNYESVEYSNNINKSEEIINLDSNENENSIFSNREGRSYVDKTEGSYNQNDEIKSKFKIK